ncbi:hypothetical protein KP509_17G032000 [Ceratopteris richardii]|uniref:K Homology domain-containing protein n=1 Tax=Ceratopteris richardii TaxID=49495 RepID=A0A8T2SY55_CERRI|nr:hypothetical protein KP509_17G032000 [Ceratopteris richardii]KAH7372981.1 hypothetical protein KP509_17G032000 [Ceratopteris richardii]KAH7372982.1 hypothetical protein KP509_17G032000 [Ceratopteris richardii]KAH7372983.1 hypothetical protein KP509_17G032000 [Ceratopteris richardii]KAH7372984.1 hypothetical protein KP509_17G032000 [Ceratopteris richardii]
MDDPYYRSRGKRGHSYRDREYMEPSGRYKKFASEDPYGTPSPVLPKQSPTDTVFRLLCPESKIGCVIGKGGSIVKNLRHETGAKIFIPDFIEGAEERVIHISSSESDWERIKEMERGARDRDKDKDGRQARLPPAQDALMQIHARILEGGNPKEPNVVEDVSSRGVTTRMLVPNSQVGCLLGKGGHIIEQMRQESKTQIRILPRDQAPYCAMPTDEIVQIIGDASAVKKALQLVSTQLFENPPRDRHPAASRSPIRGSFLPDEVNSLHQAPRANYNSGHHTRSFQLPLSDYCSAASDKVAHYHGSRDLVSEHKNELAFRILCPREKIGSIIGKGGNVVRSLEEDIGVSIDVRGSVSGSEERVIMVSSVEQPDDNISPAQEALLHLQTKIADLGPDEDAVITTRLLISASQVSCLLGTGGSTIAEMRRITGANIRILGKDDLPMCADPTDQVVQIVGDIRKAREALIQVTKRLRSNMYAEKTLDGGGIPPPINNSASQTKHEFLSLGQPDFSAPSLPNAVHAPSSYVKSSPPGYWMEKELFGGARLAGYESPLPKEPDFFRATGAMVTKTTIEVVLPNRIVSTVFGDGSKIAQIRQISGAQVNFLEVRPGSMDSVVEISGTPEQAQSAQNLLQSFIRRGQASPLGYT